MVTKEGLRPPATLTSVMLAASLAASLGAATLEKLELDQMILKSTEIVRGKVTAKAAATRGAVIYTEVSVSVTERLKGATSPSVRVSVPGGTLNGVTQTFPGSPDLHTGSEYVFFLWTGKSGVTQIVGLSQGLLDLDGSLGAASGTAKLSRAAITAGLVDPVTGKAVADQPLTLTLDKLRARVSAVLGASRQ